MGGLAAPESELRRPWERAALFPATTQGSQWHVVLYMRRVGLPRRNKKYRWKPEWKSPPSFWLHVHTFLPASSKQHTTMLAEITNSPRNITTVTKHAGFTTPAKAAKAIKTKTPSSTKRTTRQSSSSHFKAGLQRQNEIELTFSEDGPLGFLFAGSGEILQTDGQSTSSGMQVLDEITAVGDVRVIEGMGHDEVLMLLKSAARPCKITVRRMNEEDKVAKPTEATAGQMVRTGNLQKLSTKNLWQKRTFRLNSLGELHYFSGSGKLGGLIDLTQCFGIEAVGQSIRIQMDEAGQTNIKLRANSKAKAGDWVRDIEDVTGYIWGRNWSPSRQCHEQNRAGAAEEEAAFKQRRHGLQMAAALGMCGVPHMRLVVDGKMLRDASYALGAEVEDAEIKPLFDEELEELASAAGVYTNSHTSICTCDFPHHVMRSRSSSIDGILRRVRTRSPVETAPVETAPVETAPVETTRTQQIKQFSEDELIQIAQRSPNFLQRVLGKCAAIPATDAKRAFLGKEGRTRRRSRLSSSRRIESLAE